MQTLCLGALPAFPLSSGSGREMSLSAGATANVILVANDSRRSVKLGQGYAEFLCVLGKSPMSYFQSLRVERAVHLLKTSKASVEEIAAQVGYMDGRTLRLLLRQRLNLGVKQIRRAS